jgi:hypothetical protein
MHVYTVYVVCQVVCPFFRTIIAMIQNVVLSLIVLAARRCLQRWARRHQAQGRLRFTFHLTISLGYSDLNAIKAYSLPHVICVSQSLSIPIRGDVTARCLCRDREKIPIYT